MITDTEAMDRLLAEWNARDDEEGFNGGDAVELIGELLTATGRLVTDLHLPDNSCCEET